MSEERPLTAQEAQQELYYFKESYEDTCVGFIAGTQMKLASGVTVRVISAQTVRDRLFFIGTMRNGRERR